MRKSLPILLLTVFPFLLSAQEYKHGLGIQIGAFDFYGPLMHHYGYHKETNLATNQQEKMLMWEPAIHVSYNRALLPRLTVQVGAWAANVHYPGSDIDSNFIHAKQGLLQLRASFPYYVLDLKGQYSLLPKEKYYITPYITSGISANYRKDQFGLEVPSGLGLNIKITNEFYINWESNYRYVLNIQNLDNFSHAIGIHYWWRGKHKPKPEPKVAPAKEDPKPIVMYEDPKEPVVMRDTDKDGLMDHEDQCPYHAGPKEKGGCPDKDNDGVYDFEDKCPNVAGPAVLNGCPDSDGDGLSDADDRCPNEAGKRESYGCPEVKEEVKKQVDLAAKGIYFETNKAILKPESYTQLDIIFGILQGDATLNVDIEGHTDNTGKPENNLELSQQRADVCKNYLIKKGLAESRITSVGYGDMRPVADNSTEEGKAKNRRTEFILKH